MWVTDGREFEAVQLRYAQKISKALGTVLARLRTESPELACRIATHLSRATETATARVLLSPSVSQRLLWDGDPAAGIGEFLESCFRMEAIAQDSDTESVLPMWGALGDCVVRDTGEVVRWEPVDRQLAVDLESPDTIAIGSTPPAQALGWTPLAPEAQRGALNALTAGYRLARSAARAFEPSWTSAPELSSFVNSKPGSSVLSHHAITWDASCSSTRIWWTRYSCAQALVHESIHSYLYMHEPRPLWGLNPDVTEEPGVVQSPWTGRELPLSTFLHACFVWYGILFFWGRAMGSALPLPDGVRREIARASSGFTKGALLGHIGSGRIASVRHEVQAALAEMQQKVLAVLGGETLSHVQTAGKTSRVARNTLPLRGRTGMDSPEERQKNPTTSPHDQLGWSAESVSAPPQRYAENYTRYSKRDGINLKTIAPGFTHKAPANEKDMARFFSFCLIYDQIKKEGIAGDMAEVGVYRGNTACIIAEFARQLGVNVYLFDTFKGLPEHELRGLDNKDFRGLDPRLDAHFVNTSLRRVTRLVGEANVIYVKGSFPESTDQIPDDRKFCLVHVDCDLYCADLDGLAVFLSTHG